MADTIEDILEKSDKAELIESLGDVLDTEGCKVVIITGVPNNEGGLSLHVLQTGHKYRYEVYGFIREGVDILMDMGEGDEP